MTVTATSPPPHQPQPQPQIQPQLQPTLDDNHNGTRSLKILISGAGCAGPALAFWLARAGHRVTIVEQAPALRDAGAHVRLSSHAFAVLDRMGLLPAVRDQLLDDAGVSFVDSHGRPLATVPPLTSKRSKRQSCSRRSSTESDLKKNEQSQDVVNDGHMVRGDLIRILYDATKDKVTYIFGNTVDSFEQTDKAVYVTFADGSSDTFHLLVGADGQNSPTRKAILPPYSTDDYRRLGIHSAYWSLSRGASLAIPEADTLPHDGTAPSSSFTAAAAAAAASPPRCETYHAPGGRMVVRRTRAGAQTHVSLHMVDLKPPKPSSTSPQPPRPSSSGSGSSAAHQREAWAARFRGAGWYTDRLLDGMLSAPDVYLHEAALVRSARWHRRRVVLLGDAAHCDSPFSGTGATACLVGAYVLAGHVTRYAANPASSSSTGGIADLSAALSAYEATMRGFVAKGSKTSPSLLRTAIPKTRLGVAMLRLLIETACLLRLPALLKLFSSSDERPGWKLPDFPELDGTSISSIKT